MADTIFYSIIAIAIPVWITSIVYIRQVWIDCERRRQLRLKRESANG